MDESSSGKCKQSSARDERTPPMRQAHFHVPPGLQGQCVTGPRQECVPLGDHPIQPAIQMYDDQRRDRRFCCDQGGIGCGGRDALVEKGYAERESSEGLEDGEGRDGLSTGISPVPCHFP